MCDRKYDGIFLGVQDSGRNIVIIDKEYIKINSKIIGEREIKHDNALCGINYRILHRISIRQSNIGNVI